MIRVQESRDQTTGCSTLEDGMGESVHFMLHGARSMDSSITPVLAIVSAGNRSQLLPVPTGSAGSMFFPAQLARPVCADCPLALAVGAVDELRAPSTVTITDAEPALVAPGENIYPGRTSYNWDYTPAAYQCTPAPPAPLKYTTPSAFSGTSMAAALVTGAAARAYTAHLDRLVAFPAYELPLS